jgi:hypothetical protein
LLAGFRSRRAAAATPTFEALDELRPPIGSPLPRQAAEPENFEAAGELFRSLNAKLFLRFADVQQGRRVIRKPVGGIHATT